MRIILASNSPRRRELMKLILRDFETASPDVDEKKITEDMQNEGKSPEEIACALAAAKAEAAFVAAGSPADTVVIGADTSVVTGSQILGKPEGREDAVRMLTELSGITHRVITGVCLFGENGIRQWAEVSLVEFYQADDFQTALIERYCDSDEPYDKAGAYGIQGGGALLVKRMEGDYFNVVGLPVGALARELEKYTGERSF